MESINQIIMTAASSLKMASDLSNKSLFSFSSDTDWKNVLSLMFQRSPLRHSVSAESVVLGRFF